MEEVNVTDISKMSQSKKIAIVLAQFPDICYKVINCFSKEEQQEILSEIAQTQNLSQSDVDKILNEFLEFYINNAVALQGGMDVVKDILVKMYGDDAANDALSQLSANIAGSPLQALKKIDTESLINFVRGAHPQIIATLLCYLNDPVKSAAVLSKINKNVMDQVIKGMASMENGRTSDDMVAALEKYVDDTFASSMYSKDKNNKIGGINTVVQVMNSVDMNTEQFIMDKLEEDTPELAEDIKKRMFIFDDFIKLSDRDIQLVLREFTNDEQLATCLRYSNKDLRSELTDKFLNNMSKRKADIVRESMDMISKVKAKDLEEARQAITAVAKKLHEEGQISLGNNIDDEYIE